MGGGTLRRVNAHRGGGVLEKLAVAQEPGLTNAQLMLTNHDLKPGKGRQNFSLYPTPQDHPSPSHSASVLELTCRRTVEPERRQWGPWNFVGFWIADSFNIVREENGGGGLVSLSFSPLFSVCVYIYTKLLVYRIPG
jgi:hypothetical protein